MLQMTNGWVKIDQPTLLPYYHHAAGEVTQWDPPVGAEIMLKVPPSIWDQFACLAYLNILVRCNEAPEQQKCATCDGKGSIWDKFAGLAYADICTRCKDCDGDGMVAANTSEPQRDASVARAV